MFLLSMPTKNLYVINGNCILFAANEKDEPVCVARGCHETKVDETLFGLNFCESHFIDYYSDAELEFERWEDASNFTPDIGIQV